MKRPLLLVSLLLVLAPFAPAQAPFPGLKSVLSEAEWKRAGLDRLSPDEIGVIDAALIRHLRGTTAQLESELVAAKQEVATANAIAATPVGSEKKKSFLERFGLPILSDVDWRTLPPLKAKVVAWEAGNRFRLDNGQVWEGFQPIPYDLIGKEIEIQARPHGQFALVVEGANTKLRVLRLR